jgi:carbamoyl-phosphate synthase large subunit
MQATLFLENGSKYKGVSFGYQQSVAGEVVFSTNMSGYTESLTDPSFCDQVLCLTYPLIGNYGVPSADVKDKYGLLSNMESENIWIKALIISNYSEHYCHYNAGMSLAEWLLSHKIPALYGIDTRCLTKELRANGSLKGKIVFNSEQIEYVNINELNLIKKVSCTAPYTLGNGILHIAVVDCGVKLNILRNLLKEGFKVTIVPYDYDFNSRNFDGLFLSNGPGDPSMCTETIHNLTTYINSEKYKPVFGICLGNQLLAHAAGGKTYKMKYGNRGYNQPVLMVNSNKTFITSQNHGFAVAVDSLPEDWEEYFVNKNDKSNEGIIHKCKPFKSVQFHPEARGGPYDTIFMFKEFYDTCLDYKYGSIRKNKVLLLGSGGLSIGQAGEFDYSGSQAIKSFKEGGFEVILVNPNIATIQTSEGLADDVYYVPVQPDFITDIIMKERPHYISLSFGGQTALNCGIDLWNSGTLYKYNVVVLGTSVGDILKTEDRDLFAKEMTLIGEKTPRSLPATNIEDALCAAKEIGYPVLCRAAFALGGLGSGFCDNETELHTLLEKTFTKTNQVLIDEDLRGWKEIEYEVMRDQFGNAITVCNMENFDPLGIHTGDSIVIAPSQTLNSDEYNMLRGASLKIANRLNIIGECNVQMTLDPRSNEYRIIEVNPRLSRSSALASKATGYPIASVAAQLCAGHKLHEITNVVTGTTTANFEPSLDYVVVKIPRWDTRKFCGVDAHLGSAMKSVGEVMAIGRTFEEAFQKGLRMVKGVGFVPYGQEPSLLEIRNELKYPTDERVRILAHVLYSKILSIGQVHELSNIDPWFLHKLNNICNLFHNSNELTPGNIRLLKLYGFSDEHIGSMFNMTEVQVREYRKSNDIVPCVKKIDTLAGEFPAETNYLYTTWGGDTDDVEARDDKKVIIVLGSGTYRIGSSVEFDYCSVKCVQALRNMGYYTVMVNYNPETISTDFDESDKLYFEELSFERVADIFEKENAYGVIVSMGGQQPNNIVMKLHEYGIKVLGTAPDSIDRCEDRSRYSGMLDALKISQPAWISATNRKDIKAFVEKVQYPVVVRPSYVLSGAAMRIVHDPDSLESCLCEAANISPQHPVVLTKFIEKAKEVDVDAVCNGGEIVVYAICEHVENAGVHSGDATLVLPPHTLSQDIQNKMVEIVRIIGKTLKVSGLFNTQFLVKDGTCSVIETNLRSSRSIPFVSKTMDIDFIKLGTKAILGENTEAIHSRTLPFFGVKCPQFSFARLPEADPVLGIEMTSTGEVACFGVTFEEAYIKSLIASRSGYPVDKKMTILKLDDSDTLTFEKLGHTVISYSKDIDWKKIHMVVDCTNSLKNKGLRRNAIDFSKYLVTNSQQLYYIGRSLNVSLYSNSYNFYKKMLYISSNKKIFVRQGFTESSVEKQQQLQRALDSLVNFQKKGVSLTLLTGNKAESKDTFKTNFEIESGKEFTPHNFRTHRLETMDKADAFVILRTSLSESTVFEVAYNILRGPNIPIFYAIDAAAPLKTTLLRELTGFCGAKVVYKTMDSIENIGEDLDFINFIEHL